MLSSTALEIIRRAVSQIPIGLTPGNLSRAIKRQPSWQKGPLGQQKLYRALNDVQSLLTGPKCISDEWVRSHSPIVLSISLVGRAGASPPSRIYNRHDFFYI